MSYAQPYLTPAYTQEYYEQNVFANPDSEEQDYDIYTATYLQGTQLVIDTGMAAVPTIQYTQAQIASQSALYTEETFFACQTSAQPAYSAGSPLQRFSNGGNSEIPWKIYAPKPSYAIPKFVVEEDVSSPTNPAKAENAADSVAERQGLENQVRIMQELKSQLASPYQIYEDDSCLTYFSNGAGMCWYFASVPETHCLPDTCELSSDDDGVYLTKPGGSTKYYIFFGPRGRVDPDTGDDGMSEDMEMVSDDEVY